MKLIIAVVMDDDVEDLVETLVKEKVLVQSCFSADFQGRESTLLIGC